MKKIILILLGSALVVLGISFRPLVLVDESQSHEQAPQPSTVTPRIDQPTANEAEVEASRNIDSLVNRTNTTPVSTHPQPGIQPSLQSSSHQPESVRKSEQNEDSLAFATWLVPNAHQEILADLQEREPRNDLRQFNLVKLVAPRMQALFPTDIFFRRFFSPALYELEIVRDVISYGVLPSQHLQADTRLLALTQQPTPYIGALCSKTNCLVAWVEDFQPVLDPANDICNYIEQHHGWNCKPAPLSDHMVGPLEFSQAAYICGSTLNIDCYQAVLAPVNAVIFNHKLDATNLAKQAFFNGWLAQYGAMPAPVALAMAEDTQAKVPETHGWYLATRQGSPDAAQANSPYSVAVSADVPALDFQPFPYSQLASKLYEPEFRNFVSIADCQDTTNYQRSNTEVINGSYQCYINKCHSHPSQCTEAEPKSFDSLAHMTMVWHRMQGL